MKACNGVVHTQGDGGCGTKEQMNKPLINTALFTPTHIHTNQHKITQHTVSLLPNVPYCTNRIGAMKRKGAHNKYSWNRAEMMIVGKEAMRL